MIIRLQQETPSDSSICARFCRFLRLSNTLYVNGCVQTYKSTFDLKCDLRLRDLCPLVPLRLHRDTTHK